MFFIQKINTRWNILYKNEILNHVFINKRWFSLTSNRLSVRNIGIMAHVDAGKTTTTERMLYYSGHIKFMGDVDTGNTVTDYLPIEMERGITVQSAAVSFDWMKTNINLIDTPGHVDFTIEVERSLRVLDGSIAIFDAAKGVQAQSRTVWKQANRHRVPRLVFISKMDKPSASFHNTLISLETELDSKFLPIQLPLYNGKEFVGNIDVVKMIENRWSSKYDHGKKGRLFDTKKLEQDHELWQKAVEVRTNLIEKLADIDDTVAEVWLDDLVGGDPLKFPFDLLQSAIKKSTLQHFFVPVLCGSSFKNIGVQPLLDAVVDYLPAPNEVQHEFLKFYNGSLVATAFKVLHDKRLGPVVFVRIYSGSISSRDTLYNVNKEKSENSVRLLKANANEFLTVDKLVAGDIGIMSGLKHTVTGDTLVASEHDFQSACEKACLDGRSGLDAVLSSVRIPESVFYCALYTNSLTEEKLLVEAMNKISCEDPSIRLQMSDEGEMILSGMGELHVEVITERLRKEFKIDLHVGPINIAYKEQATVPVSYTEKFERLIFDTKHTVTINVSILPDDQDVTLREIRDVKVKCKESHKTDAACRGVVQACRKGALLGFPVIATKVVLNQIQTSSNCPMSLITSSTIKCVRNALMKAKCILKQPMMQTEITTTNRDPSIIITELLKCHAIVDDVTFENRHYVIRAVAPVDEMKGFPSKLRSATSGRADLSMHVIGYDVVPPHRVDQLRDTLQGTA